MDSFETKDLGLASALVTLGYTLLEVRKEGKQGIFVFDPGSDVAAQEYFAGRLIGNLNLFMTTVKNLKSLVNNTR